MSAPLKVLIAEDNPRDAELLLIELRRGEISTVSRVVEDEAAFRAALHDFDPDVILSDFSFPRFDGLSALRAAGEMRPDTPFIFVSGTIGEERAVQAIHEGAADYVLKTNLQQVPRAVRRAVEEAMRRRRRRAADEHVARLGRIRDVLAAVNAAIVRTQDPDTLYGEACRIAVELGKFPFAIGIALDPKTGTSRVAAASGRFAQGLDDVIQRAVADPQRTSGAFARALRNLRPAVINDLEREAELDVHHVLVALGTRSMACFPFVIVDTMVGALMLGAKERDAFDDQEIALFSDLANNLSFALNLIDKQRRLDFLSYFDPLTGLANRILCHQRIAEELNAARREGRRLGFLVADVVRFSAINATYGESFGDLLLRAIANRLAETMGTERVARLSGDHFAVLLPGLDARSVGELIDDGGLRCLASPFTIYDRSVRVSSRVGCSLFPDDAADADTLLLNAEAALRSAKGIGAVYRFFAPDLHRRVADRLDVEARLRRAADEGEFVLHYQPKVELPSRKIVGLEALIRWRDPDRGLMLVPPGEFISILEDMGLILTVGRWVIQEAAEQYHRWIDARVAAPRIAVNVSGVQLRQDWLIEDIRSVMKGRLRTCGLDVELTESILMHDLNEVLPKLEAIREFGVEISIDDFGTGYSSLAYINRLPVSALKIDRSFIETVTEEADKTTIVQTILTLGHGLNFKIVAEGVETEAQASLLHLLRYDQIQGFLVGKPMPADEIAPLLPSLAGS